MIYDLSLQTAGYLAGLFLLVPSLFCLVQSEASRRWMTSFPRSRTTGAILLTLGGLWAFWLLYTMQMGEFSGFRRPLLFLLPVAYVLVLRFVDEFLAVRALGILYLLAAEPLLEAAFLRIEPSRLFVTVLAYVIITKGLFYVMMPYLMRDGLAWSTRSDARWRLLHSGAAAYGLVLLGLALTIY